MLNICLTLPTTGGIGRAGGAGQTAGHTPTALGTQIEPLKSHRSFTIAKYSAANAHKQPYSTFLLQAGQAVAGGGVATPTSVHSECSHLPPPSCSLPAPPANACIHTDCAYAALPCGFGLRFIVELPVPGLPVLPASLICPLNSWLTNFAGFQLRPRS